MKHDLTSNAASTIVEQLHQRMVKLGLPIPLLFTKAVLAALTFVGVTYVEYEILYRVFESVAGKNSQYWTPSIMGLTALIIVIAVHYLAEKSANGKDSVTMQFINRTAAFLIPLYLLGIGLLLANLLYKDGLSSGSAEYTVGGLSNSDTAEPWLDIIMTTFAAPLANALFAIGVGAMATISTFVSHHAIRHGGTALNEANRRKHLLKQSTKDIGIYRHASAEVQTLETKINHFIARNDDAIRNKLASQVLVAMQHANNDKKADIATQKAKYERFSIVPPPPPSIDFKKAETAMAKIDAITLGALLQHMK